MAHKFDPDHFEVLHTEERKRIFPADAAVEILDCKPGDVVADIGCGTGYLTIPIAGCIGGTGTVYAFDTSDRMLNVLQRRAEDLGITNIKTAVSEEYRLPVDSGKCDRAVMSSVFPRSL